MADAAVEANGAKSKATAKSAPKWETEARDRVRTGLRKFSRPLADIVSRDANEGDTRLIVTDFLCDALGYDKYADLTTEYQVRGEFADYGVRIDKQMIALIEVKRATTKLTDRHLRQVEMYAVNEGIEWMILTNGVCWQAYHLTPGMPVQIDKAIDVDLLGEGTPAHKADQLFYLTREAMKRRAIDELWKARSATSPKRLAQTLLCDAVIDAIRKEIRKQSNHNEDPAELARLLRTSVIRAECFEK